MDKWPFDLRKDDFDNWIVQGRMTASDTVCNDNPSEGASAMPVSSLPGERVPTSTSACL